MQETTNEAVGALNLKFSQMIESAEASWYEPEFYQRFMERAYITLDISLLSKHHGFIIKSAFKDILFDHIAKLLSQLHRIRNAAHIRRRYSSELSTVSNSILYNVETAFNDIYDSVNNSFEKVFSKHLIFVVLKHYTEALDQYIRSLTKQDAAKVFAKRLKQVEKTSHLYYEPEWVTDCFLDIPNRELSPIYGIRPLAGAMADYVHQAASTAQFQDLDAMFMSCVALHQPHPDTAPSPFPLDILTADPTLSQPIGRRLLEGLRESWNDSQKSKDVWQLHYSRYSIRSILKAVHKKAVKRRKALWARVRSSITQSSDISIPKAAWNLFGAINPLHLATLFREASSGYSQATNVHELIAAFYVACAYEQKAYKCRTAVDNLPHTEYDAQGPDELRAAAMIRTQHTGRWSPLEHPETLLFEVERRIIVRPDQMVVLEYMLGIAEGEDHHNEIMQMVNGWGKSFVLTPLLCARLARQGTIPRLTVLSSLFDNNFASLRHWLGGMLGIRTLVFPCHRQTPLTPGLARTMLRQLCQGTGMFLTVPEHWLSRKLKARESLLKGEVALAHSLDALSSWLDDHSMTILDESDELLSPRWELIYTLGLQGPLDEHMHRWRAISMVLFEVNNMASDLARSHPHTFTLSSVQSAGRWKGLRIIANTPENLLGMRRQLAVRLLKHPALERYSDRYGADIIRSCITGDNDHFFKQHPNSSVTPLLQMLRGLLHHDILGSVLKKRHGVQFGVDPTRRLMAIPFRAKDTPAKRAEYGHPDIALALSFMAYFYTGLSKEQFTELLTKHVLPSQVRDTIWGKIIDHGDSLASDHGWIDVRMRQVECVNIKDAGQVHRLYMSLRHNMMAVHYYLLNFVFPQESKQFPQRLQSSSWDIATPRTAHPLRGFSGTVDSAAILPAGVRLRELPQLRHTNGTVVGYITHPANAYRVIPGEGRGRDILRQVVELGCSVLIDAGAQMMDLDNEGVAREWLALTDASSKAAVYYDEHLNVLTVLTRQGVRMKLNSSLYASNLKGCLCYFDDFHSRGTDLPGLPKSGIRAALTLGPGMPKDKLVQSSMRLRQLGRGQSLTFLAPSEVHAELLAVTETMRPGSLVAHTPAADVRPSSVVLWSLRNTVHHLHRSMVLWAGQGCAYGHNQSVQESRMSVAGQMEYWRMKETTDLESMYAPKRLASTGYELIHRRVRESYLYSSGVLACCGPWDCVRELVLHRASRDVSGVEVWAAEFDEEQERELEQEQEQEKEVQVEHPSATPHEPKVLSVDVRSFICGTSVSLLLGSDLSSIHTAFAGTTIPGTAGLWTREAVCSEYFREVVTNQGILDDFLRPPMFAVARRGARGVLLVSAWEAAQILRERLIGSSCRMCLLHRRTGTTVPFYVGEGRLPGLLDEQVAAELSLFAGSMFWASERERALISRFLTVSRFGADGVTTLLKVVSRIMSVRDSESRLEGSPLEVMLEVFKIRHKA
eukprot:gnl/Dysnectes_brevis/3014_a3723_500.p1 GENE.gnl/Dysnectes_brevis/3014_a3723_500~~gnl/Dysnectes_brevis/3014_a3723_500.p1  ORF type:complete len:1463 (+),score=446.01 gnl/Dysnectes_brevis/3014_a3723_500:1092-5480(+)